MDIKDARKESDNIILLNDTEEFNKEILKAFNSYDIKPIRWSEIGKATKYLVA